MKTILTMFTLVLFSHLALALSPVQQKCLNWAYKTPGSATASPEALGKYLSKVSEDEYTRALAAFVWLTLHIDYDWDTYKAIELGVDRAPQDAASVLRAHKGVCAGYSELYKAVCTAMGLRCEIVSGYAKGLPWSPFTGETSINHAWNAVQIYGQWQLVDATWGTNEGTSARTDFYYFCASPHQFLDHHLPSEPKWQLTNGKPMDLATFNRRPFFWNAFHEVGFEAVFPMQPVLTVSSKPFNVSFRRAFIREWRFSMALKSEDGKISYLPVSTTYKGDMATLTFSLPSDAEGKLTFIGNHESLGLHSLVVYGVRAATVAAQGAAPAH